MTSSMGWLQLGTIDKPGFWHVPPLPSIVSEWAGIVPLVCHLASRRHGHQCIGQVSLLGRLWVGLFPRLGVLSGLAKLLKTGSAFLDDASTKGSSNTIVWDVTWGGSFPCANGAASAALVEYAMKRAPAPLKMPEQSTPTSVNSSTASTASRIDEKIVQVTSTGISKQPPSSFRRYQTLHVLKFGCGRRKISTLRKLELLLSSRTGETILFVALLGLSIVLGLLGTYGSAALVLSSAVAQFVCYFYTVRRPPGYLDSNEQQQNCYMLIATHQNVHNWYLFTGDRGVVDTLLNKTMVDLPQSTYGKLLAAILNLAHCVQLLGMTFVAAQKGWDGVILVILLFASRVFRWRYGNKQLARTWLETEGITVDTRSYQFTGRTMMLGAILKLHESKITSWMDSIITPHPRREAWLAYLLMQQVPDAGQWSEHDLMRIRQSAEFAEAAAEMMRKDLK